MQMIAENFFADAWRETIAPFFASAGDFLLDFFRNIAEQADRFMEQSVFWRYALPIVCVLLILVILISIAQGIQRGKEKRRLKREKQFYLKDAAERRERSFRDNDAAAQEGAREEALRKKLLAASEWNAELEELCRAQGPDAIIALAPVWLRLPQSVKKGLAELASSESWMAQYILRMDGQRYTADFALLLWEIAPDPDCLPLIAELLGAKEQSAQMAAVELIGKMDEPRLVPYLVDALLQPDRFVTARVGEALAAMGPQAAQICAEMLPRAEEQDNLQLLETLSLFDCEYDTSNVAACLGSPSEKVRARAARALGESRNRQAAERLIRALRDDAPAVRAAAVTALGQLQAAEALPQIEALQNDEDWTVRANCQRVINILQNK